MTSLGKAADDFNGKYPRITGRKKVRRAKHHLPHACRDFGKHSDASC